MPTDLLTPYRPGAEWALAVVNMLAALAVLSLILLLPRRLNDAKAPDVTSSDPPTTDDEEPDHGKWIENLCWLLGTLLLFVFLTFLPSTAGTLVMAFVASSLIAFSAFLFFKFAHLLHECAAASRGFLAVFALSAIFSTAFGWGFYEMEGQFLALVLPVATIGLIIWAARKIKSWFIFVLGLLCTGYQTYIVLSEPPAWRLSSDFFSPQAIASFIVLHLAVLALITMTIARAPARTRESRLEVAR